MDTFIDREKTIISDYISAIGGHLFTTLAKNAKSVIEFGNTDYDIYCKLKEKGYKIYHSFYVIEYISTHNKYVKSIATPKSKVNIPKFDAAKRVDMREYLRLIESEISDIIKNNEDGFEPK